MRFVGMRKRFVAAMVLMASAGCAASSRQRPVSVGEVGAGPESLAWVRQQLQGQWVLSSLTAYGEDGKKVTVDSAGSLTTDAYGSLRIVFKMTDEGQKALSTIGITSPNPVVTTEGRAAIEPVKKEITFVGVDYKKQGGMDAGLAAKRANPFALERIRYYTFNPDGTLTLLTRYDNGKDAVVGIWKRSS